MDNEIVLDCSKTYTEYSNGIQKVEVTVHGFSVDQLLEQLDKEDILDWLKDN